MQSFYSWTLRISFRKDKLNAWKIGDIKYSASFIPAKSFVVEG